MFFLNHKMKKLFILLVIGIISSLQTLSWSVEPDKDLVLYLPMEKDLFYLDLLQGSVQIFLNMDQNWIYLDQ